MALHKLALVALLIDWLIQWYNVRWYAENVQAVELLPHLLILPSSVSKVSFVLYDVVSIDQLFPSRNEFIFCFLLLLLYGPLFRGAMFRMVPSVSPSYLSLSVKTAKV